MEYQYIQNTKSAADMNCVAAVTAGYGSFFRLKLASSCTSDTQYYMTCAIHKSYVQWMDNFELFQITVIMNMSGMEECEGECWAGWDTWDYWSSVWIEGVILPAIAALGIAGRRRKKLHCNLREDHSALMFIHCLVLSASSSLKRRIEQIKFWRIY